MATSMTSEESLQNDETKTEGKWARINHLYDLKENAYFLIFNLEKVTLRSSKWDFSFFNNDSIGIFPFTTRQSFVSVIYRVTFRTT